jgi:hypothetical protein
MSRSSQGIVNTDGGTRYAEVPSVLGSRVLLGIDSPLDEGRSRVGRGRVGAFGMRSTSAAVRGRKDDVKG